MKHYYRIADAVIQAGILTAWLAAWLMNASFSVDFYFIAGSWHLISLIVHLLVSSKKYKPVYTVFSATVCGIVTLFFIGLAGIPWLMVFALYILLFAGPVLALLYTASCFAEIRYLNKRPMSYLK